MYKLWEAFTSIHAWQKKIENKLDMGNEAKIFCSLIISYLFMTLL